jgi:hypothetical protein
MIQRLRKVVAVASIAGAAVLSLPAAAQSDQHQHEQGAQRAQRGQAPGMMSGQGMGGMMDMMQGCPMMRSGGHGMPHLPPGNEKLELQMHADMMKAMGDILAKYAARLPERK